MMRNLTINNIVRKKQMLLLFSMEYLILKLKIWDFVENSRTMGGIFFLIENATFNLYTKLYSIHHIHYYST